MPEQDYYRRFSGIEKLYGEQGLKTLAQSHVVVIGVGGVGSWTVESLARSAIGSLTLIDLDHVSESNINRQIHALESTLGQAKVAVLASRIKQINPLCKVRCVEDFITRANIPALLNDLIGAENTVVVDCIDHARTKAGLIAWCKQNKIKIITVGGAGACIDPMRVRQSDLSRTEDDLLLSKTRRHLRRDHQYPRNIKRRFSVPAIYSDEKRMETKSEVGGLNCAGYGSAVHVTASLGFAAAGKALSLLLAQN